MRVGKLFELSGKVFPVLVEENEEVLSVGIMGIF